MQTEELIKLLFKASQNLKDSTFLKNNGERTFNNTEMRLIGCVIMNEELGKKIISTQIADALCITRSAVSQMVNRLEERGVVRRAPSEYDKKIAYIELSDSTRAEYEKQKAKLAKNLELIAERMGQDDMNEFVRLLSKFFECKDRVMGKK